MSEERTTAAPLAADIAWLDARLNEVEPPASRRDMERIESAVQSMFDAEPADNAAPLDDLAINEIQKALKLLTTRFHLRNKAEQVHIARVNRRREREATSESPRAESLSHAIASLEDEGVSLSQIQNTLRQLDIQPTLTAHPTESRRRSVMQKQARIADLLAVNNDPNATPAEREFAESGVRQTLSLLLVTDEVRSRRLEVIDEVRNGIGYLSGAIWDAAPRLYRDLERAIRDTYNGTIDVPTFLRYRSWIGGDRDGNPNVTAELTKLTFDEMRAAAVARHHAALEQLRRDLSVSERRVEISPQLRDSIARDQQHHPIDPHLTRHLQREPFRVKIRHMQSRLGDSDYSSDRFTADLEVLRTGLQKAGLHEVAESGPLSDAIIRARTFGFHLAALDIRQDSRVHEPVVAELFRIAGVVPNYAELDESDRFDVLRRELQTPRPLLARGTQLSKTARELLDALDVIGDAVRKEPESVGSYVISMARAVSDVLEVLILLREAGLWTIEDGDVRCPIDVAPLFETVDDLERGGDVIRALFKESAYAGQLAARGNFQEIMLGYSDSNKDGGYWAANWRLHRAQDDLARACHDAGVTFRFFHGRGGTVARGGGRAHRAILASPEASRNGRIRFTEQGEVISFRYSMPAIARRHLEQIANAMILATARAEIQADLNESNDDMASLMNELAESSRDAYRALIDDPEFWPWFVERSPVLHIGELPIASRPVSRSGGEVLFTNLRAIPWVFAWTQMRYNAPGWYGIGTAFEQCVMHDDARVEQCKDAYAKGGYFRAFIDNAQQEMARARLSVARWYSGDVDTFHQKLAEEFGKAERMILAVTGQNALLDNNPVIQLSIRERNPDTDAINAMQVELLRRWRRALHEDDVDAQQKLRPLILLSVNALAAAMQSTG